MGAVVAKLQTVGFLVTGPRCLNEFRVRFGGLWAARDRGHQAGNRRSVPEEAPGVAVG